MIGFCGDRITDDIARHINEVGASGIILFADNLVDAAQTATLIRDLRAAIERPIVVAMDQEGGAVLRLAKGVTVFPGNAALGAVAQNHELSLAAALARRQGEETGRQLRALGVDLNLAPVVDVDSALGNPALSLRSFGNCAEQVQVLAQALVQGQLEAGLYSCLKHFPGLGGAALDPHFALPKTAPHGDRDHYRQHHLAPFRELIALGLPLCIMSTHLMLTPWDEQRMVTHSRQVIHELLRQELGFEGCLLTDCLEMGALFEFSQAESALMAARAGHDFLIVSRDQEGQLAAAKKLRHHYSEVASEEEVGENRKSCARISELQPQCRSSAMAIPSDPGDFIATEIARLGVTVFADEASILPVNKGLNIEIIAAVPKTMPAQEESLSCGFDSVLTELFAEAGCENFNICEVAVEADIQDLGSLKRQGDQDPWSTNLNELFYPARRADRLVLFNWNASLGGLAAKILARACRDFADKLIVIHLRQPKDQELVPESITSLTAWGFREAQLKAIVDLILE